ncbi:hypothetical protein [Histophilus somni]|nr:hypothetical protein [Histophilus somni]QQF85238.1 hypothetical protein JFL55_05320 [Histophilus somni]
MDSYGISPSQADYELNDITLRAIHELESGIYTVSTLDELLELKDA